VIADESRQRKRRALLLGGFYVAGLLFLALRVAHLQVARHDTLSALSDSNRLRPVVVQPVRGRIYDRVGRLIVDNRPSWTVTFSPQALARDGSVLTELAAIIERPPDGIRERMDQRRGHLYTAVPVQRDVSFEVIARISERGPDLPGVGIAMEPRRRYPWGSTAAHSLGYLREINDAELAESQHQGGGYLYGDLLGKDGLEREYERVLRGTKGLQYAEVDARGRMVGFSADRNPVEPVHGSDLVTTLDIELQRVAEEAFADTARGAVIVMSPDDGALLVLASIPTFDPHDFSGVLDAATWDSLNSDPRIPLLNRAISGLYPPASTIKGITALAGLTEGVITGRTLFDPCVPGGWRLGNRTYHCWNETHGRLTVVEAIEQSCDVFFYQVGVRLGLAPLHEMAVAFGLGHPTGFTLPGEAAGLYPDRSYYDRTIGANRWVEEGQVINLSIGQGEILATPLQVATMTAAIANGGYRVTPHLVSATVAPGTDLEVAEESPAPQRIPGIGPEDLALVRAGMADVVNGENGTANHVALYAPGITVAGKTGTGQNPHGENHAWFTCYAPADDPEIVVTVLVENGGGGSAVAGPIAGRILRAWFRDLRAVGQAVREEPGGGGP